MSINCLPVQRFFILLFALLFSFLGLGQSNKTQSEKDVLYNEIARMDSVLFSAFNNHDAEKMSTMFTKDLEFYHDKNGLSGYEATVEAFKRLFGQNNEMRRELVKGSLEVYPINNYGAVEIGNHTFYHMEDGKIIQGTFKFIHLWKKENGQWKISRIISYDH
jgi:ketosteroid isomerase-like protein